VPHPDENFAATLPEEVPVADAGNGAIYQGGHDVPLFENSVAHRVGDVLTITLDEKTDASKSAITTTKKNTKADMAAPTILGGAVTSHGRNLLSNSLSDATTFDGEGNSKQSNQLTGDISVTVAKRLANGNLLVRGQKWITINQGPRVRAHPGHRAAGRHRPGQHRALDEGCRRDHCLRLEGRTE
jgi:flagellar L-ring protein precursor FlgH